LRHLSQGGDASGVTEDLSATEAELLNGAEAYRGAFEAAMDDDFNTSDAVAAIFELVKYVNTAIGKPSKELAAKMLELIVGLCELLGIFIDDKKDGERRVEDGIEALIQARQEARAAKDWARADEIRNELLLRGIELKDTPEGVRWVYK
jgi:cysteinyl-tRNA synthetase